ncbi:MAG: hypothetical protein RMK32_03860 [Anaerolineae bacterium]|nr:hypothetical protein [Thermoflexus sp.]MDW8064751.1 hypothetical protein [Anaerolineae bacterium]
MVVKEKELFLENPPEHLETSASGRRHTPWALSLDKIHVLAMIVGGTSDRSMRGKF